MVELVTRNYWWLGVTRDVGRYVEGCDGCQRMKNRTEELAGKLKLSEISEKPWTHNGGLHHKVTGSSWEGYYPSGLR